MSNNAQTTGDIPGRLHRCRARFRFSPVKQIYPKKTADYASKQVILKNK